MALVGQICPPPPPLFRPTDILERTGEDVRGKGDPEGANGDPRQAGGRALDTLRAGPLALRFGRQMQGGEVLGRTPLP